MTFTAGETGLIFYCVNHLFSQLRVTFFLNMVPGAQVLSAGNFQCTFKSACFYIPSPDLQSTRLARSSHLSHHLKQGDINIVFGLIICAIYTMFKFFQVCWCPGTESE